MHHLCQFTANGFIRFQNIVFTRLVTDGWTDEQTNGQVENIMPPVSLHWRRHKKSADE